MPSADSPWRTCLPQSGRQECLPHGQGCHACHHQRPAFDRWHRWRLAARRSIRHFRRAAAGSCSGSLASRRRQLSADRSHRSVALGRRARLHPLGSLARRATSAVERSAHARVLQYDHANHRRYPSRERVAASILRSLSEGAIRIPPGTSNGQLTADAEPRPVAVRTFYLVGNHDWFYHLPGPHYDRLRTTLVEQLGLANAPVNRFRMTRPSATKCWKRCGDTRCSPGTATSTIRSTSKKTATPAAWATRSSSSWSTASPRRSSASWAPICREATLAGLREIDNIRPSLLVPVWIDGLLERTCPLPAQRKKVKAIWDRLTDRFLALDFVRSRDTWNPVDLVDGLCARAQVQQAAEQRLGHAQFSAGCTAFAAPAMTRTTGMRWPSRTSAIAAPKHIVYGHTHFAESVPLDASYAEGYVLNQVYFNTGTWRRVYRQTQLAPAEHEFIAADNMTYLAFFQGDERERPTLRNLVRHAGARAADRAYGVLMRRMAVAGRTPHVSAAAGCRNAFDSALALVARMCRVDLLGKPPAPPMTAMPGSRLSPGKAGLSSPQPHSHSLPTIESRFETAGIANRACAGVRKVSPAHTPNCSSNAVAATLASRRWMSIASAAAGSG